MIVAVLSRPELVHDSPVVLPLAGTYISCIIPKLLDYEHLESTYEPKTPSPLHLHYIIDEDDEATDVPDFDDVEEEDDEEVEGDTEESVLVKGGKFVVSRRQRPPSLSFGDLLLLKRTHQSTPFEVRVDISYQHKQFRCLKLFCLSPIPRTSDYIRVLWVLKNHCGFCGSLQLLERAFSSYLQTPEHAVKLCLHLRGLASSIFDCCI